jgi:DNA mismatch endonuclease (patch repair protein)
MVGVTLVVMADVGGGWVSTPQGAHLRGRASRDTAPEVLLRGAVHALGLRFRLQRRLAPGCRPDLLLVGRRVAVFVDGCFWHGCPVHGRSRPWTGPNAELWQQKMVRNKQRDERSSALAAAAGFQVLRVWECEVRADPGAAARKVADLASGGMGSATGPGRP